MNQLIERSTDWAEAAHENYALFSREIGHVSLDDSVRITAADSVRITAADSVRITTADSVRITADDESVRITMGDEIEGDGGPEKPKKPGKLWGASQDNLPYAA